MTFESPAAARSFPAGEKATARMGFTRPAMLGLSSGLSAPREHTGQRERHATRRGAEDVDISIFVPTGDETAIGRLDIFVSMVTSRAIDQGRTISKQVPKLPLVS